MKALKKLTREANDRWYCEMKSVVIVSFLVLMALLKIYIEDDLGAQTTVLNRRHKLRHGERQS